MTIAEVKAKLKADGYEGEPTVEILKLHGWVPSNPLDGISLMSPVVTPEQAMADFTRLHEEAQALQVPAQILKGIEKLGGNLLRLAI